MQDRQQTVNEHIYFLGTGVRMIELGKKQKFRNISWRGPKRTSERACASSVQTGTGRNQSR